MPVIPLVPSDSPTLIFSLLRLSAHHLGLAALASQPLKSGTLSLYLSVPVPVLTPSVVISRPTTASRPSNPLNPSPLAPQIRLCWPLCAFINYIYLLTYLLTWLAKGRHRIHERLCPQSNRIYSALSTKYRLVTHRVTSGSSTSYAPWFFDFGAI